jgi:cytochrome c553
MDCHETDLRGGTMVVKSFETTCASCHDDQIKSKAAVKAGIPFLGIPRMDDRTLTGKYSIGEWPEDADQPITPYLKYLLSSDPQVRDALEKLKGADLANLPKADIEKLVAAQTLAWGIKGLIFDITTLGQDELVRRINLSSGRVLTDHEKEGVVAFINPDGLRSTFQSAFPNLQKEMADFRRNSKVASTQLVPSPELGKSGASKSVTPEMWVSQGGWYSPESSFMLYYHPRGHSDRFLSSWMNLTVNSENSAKPMTTQAVFKELSAPKAVGLCVKCHSIDASPTRAVNWMGSRPDPESHGFEHFSHSAHLSLMDSKGCLTCHSLNLSDASNKEKYAESFEPGKEDFTKFHGNFRTIDKSVCASCHQPNLVRDDCLLCHNYHIGRFKPVTPNANIFTTLSQK